MRDDQIKRLQDLSEKLADSFLLEADPGEWPGDGVAPADLTQQERGDRYWCKKNAMATGGVLRYTLDLVGKHGDRETDADGEADLDRKIKDAERRAATAVKNALDRAKKSADARR